MRNLIVIAAGMAAVLGGLPATAAVNFADQPVGILAGPLTYPGVTFTSGTGNLYVGASGSGNTLCAYAANSCAHALTLAFDAPIKNLTFLADGDDSASSTLFVTGTAIGGDFTFDAGGFDGNVHTASLFDLSAFEGITGLTITSNDSKGLGYDSFSFEPYLSGGDGSGATVPEPASWALMLAGFGFVGSMARRRRRAFVAA